MPQTTSRRSLAQLGFCEAVSVAIGIVVGVAIFRTHSDLFGAVRYTIEIWDRRLDSHQHQPAYKTGAWLFVHVGIEHERKDSKPVRQFCRLAALPGAHSYCQKGWVLARICGRIVKE